MYTRSSLKKLLKSVVAVDDCWVNWCPKFGTWLFWVRINGECWYTCAQMQAPWPRGIIKEMLRGCFERSPVPTCPPTVS